MIDYEFNEDNEFVQMLKKLGYAVKGEFIHPFSFYPNGIYSVKKDGKYFYASFFPLETFNCNNSNRVKEIYNIIYEYEIVPHCDFIDMDNGSVALFENFGETYSSFLENEKDEKIIKEVNNEIQLTLDKLHKLGFYHCDVHHDNILVHKETKKVKLIDLETCNNNIETILGLYYTDSIDRVNEFQFL